MTENEELIIIAEEDLDKFRKLGIVNEVALRNLQIKRDYRRMKKNGEERLLETLADNYNLEVNSIRCILFDSRYNHITEKIYVKELR
jgi:hypothetical protein